MGVGVCAVPGGTGPHAPGDGLGGTCGEFFDFLGVFTQPTGVGVGADDVAATALAVGLVGGGGSWSWVTSGVFAFERADQVGIVGVHLNVPTPVRMNGDSCCCGEPWCSALC